MYNVGMTNKHTTTENETMTLERCLKMSSAEFNQLDPQQQNVVLNTLSVATGGKGIAQHLLNKLTWLQKQKQHVRFCRLHAKNSVLDT